MRHRAGAAVTAVLLAAAAVVAVNPGTAAAATLSMTWSQLPAPPGDSAVQPVSGQGGVSCPAVGTCVVIGSTSASDGPEAAIATKSGSTWSAAQVPLPSNEVRNDANFRVVLGQLACSGATFCAVEGAYSINQSQDSARAGLLVTDQSGTLTSVQAPVPADHFTGLDQPILSSVACDAPGSCVAIGTYAQAFTTASGTVGWADAGLVESLSGGVWTPSALPTPADASPHESVELTSVSCGGPDSCVAVGSYWRVDMSTTDGIQRWPLIETMVNGAWSAAAAPLPADASTTLELAQSGLAAVACNGDGCAAYANYTTDTSVSKWVLEAEQAGAWTATASSFVLSTSSVSGLTAVSCGAAGSCAVSGLNTDPSGHEYGLLESFANGSWTGSVATVPSDASTSAPRSELRGVACPDATDCAAVGTYLNSTAVGLVDVFANGAWTGYDAGLSPAIGGAETPLFTAVACDAAGSCIAPDSATFVLTINANATDPTVTVNQDTAQPDPASAATVTFDAAFSEPVGLVPPSSVNTSASTTGGTLSVTTRQIDATDQRITVSGMNSAGNVVVSLPAGATSSTGTGLPSAASTSTDNTVAWSPPTLPSAPGKPVGTAGNASVTLQWAPPSNTGGGGVAITDYVVTPSKSGIAQPAVHVGAVTSATITGLTNGTSYTFTVYAVNSVGAGPKSVASAAVTPRVPTTLVITSAPSLATYNVAVTVAGKLTRADTGAALGSRKIVLDYRKLGSTGAYTAFGTTVSTNSAGIAKFTTFKPTYPVQIELSFAASGTWAASTSAPVDVPCQLNITAGISPTLATVGHTVTLSGVVSPSRAGVTISLQELVNGAWTTVGTGTVSSTSKYALTVKPTTTGTHTYRAVITGDPVFADSASPSKNVQVS